MPTSKDSAKRIVDRLAQGVPLDALTPRLRPVPESEKPIAPDIPRPRDWSEDARQARIRFLEKQREVELPQLAGRAGDPDPETLRGHIEHYIGMTRTPTGVIGPLRINGFHAHGDYFVPLATSEGTLVASYHRGARLATLAGGIAALTTNEQVQRAPGFAFETMAEAAHFGAWANQQFERMQEIAATRTEHGKLIEMLTHLEANHLYLILEYHTGDASGQNMVTFCTAAVCEDLIARSPVKPTHWFVEANMSGDKKATALSFINTRGRKVTADLVLPKRLVTRGLHTTPARMADFWRMSFVGGAQTGSIGVSGHVANGLAALFLACGQDVACVSEASVGITRLELTEKGDLYCGLTLPNLIVGTVGGGTRLPTARECLGLLHCEGTGKASKFAEICAATCLAGEVSIIGALAAGDFATAHEKLGRPDRTVDGGPS